MSKKQTEAGFGVILTLIIGLLLNIVTGGSFIPLGPAWFFLIIAVLIQFVLAITTDLKAARQLFIFISVVILLGATVLWIHPFSFVSSSDSRISQNHPGVYLPVGRLVFVDSLKDNSSQINWAANAVKCLFINNALQVEDEAKQPTGVAGGQCYLKAHTFFSNFVLEVQMQILQGPCGTISFREDYFNDSPNKDNKIYRLDICQDGSYTLSVEGAAHAKLAQGFSSLIFQGLNQLNTIGLVANGNMVTLYLNKQKVNDFKDETYKKGDQGEIALGTALESDIVGKVEYKNLKVWVLE